MPSCNEALESKETAYRKEHTVSENGPPKGHHRGHQRKTTSPIPRKLGPQLTPESMFLIFCLSMLGETAPGGIWLSISLSPVMAWTTSKCFSPLLITPGCFFMKVSIWMRCQTTARVSGNSVLDHRDSCWWYHGELTVPEFLLPAHQHWT